MSDSKPPRTAAEWFEQGRECFHRPDGVAAVKAMERVVDLDPAYCHPDGDNPHFYLGKIHEVEGRLETAIMHFTRALAVNPMDEESLIGRGSCYTVTQQHDLAIADFNRLVSFPDRQRKVPLKHLYYVIAENYRRLQQWGEAIYWARKAHAADPGNERHQQLLNEIAANLNKSRQ